MDAALVYKVHENAHPAELWERFAPHVRELARIYTTCADRGYGVLVMTW
jgi:hypothetical protein